MFAHNASDFLYHEPCQKCRNEGRDFKGNNLARYTDGHGYCFSCGYYEGEDGEVDRKVEKEYKSLGLIEGDIRALQKRGITEKTCAFFNYRVGVTGSETVQIAPFYDKDGKLVAQHIRFADKRFKWAGSFKTAQLFGQQLWRGVGGLKLIITEGELDAMTVSQLHENKYPVVSLRSGASGAIKDIKENLEWIESFETVVFAFDMDEVGRAAASECALLLSPKKARIAWLPAKDANECLQKGLLKELIQSLWEAKPYRPDGIVSGAEIKTLCETVPTKGLDIAYDELNSKIMGVRMGELIIFTAGSGLGKSTLVHEITYCLHQKYNVPVGLLCLEEGTAKTGRRWVGMKLNKNMSDPCVEYSKAEFDVAFNDTVGRGDWYAYNHFGSVDIDTILSKIRYMAVSLGVKAVMLDHISIVVSGLTDGDERKTIDVFVTRLRCLIEETGITVLAVVHLKRPEKGKSWNEGRHVSLTDLRGSASLEQLADIVVAMERNQHGSTPDKTVLRILKNRPAGICGIAGGAEFDRATGRLNPCCVSDTSEEFGFNKDSDDEF